MTRLMASPITQLVVVAASLLAAASMGGGFLAGVVLVPMLVVLGARAGRVAAAVDALLAAVLSAELGWAATYVTVGAQQPLIWLAPIVRPCSPRPCSFEHASSGHPPPRRRRGRGGGQVPAGSRRGCRGRLGRVRRSAVRRCTRRHDGGAHQLVHGSASGVSLPLGGRAGGSGSRRHPGGVVAAPARASAHRITSRHRVASSLTTASALLDCCLGWMRSKTAATLPRASITNDERMTPS